MIEAAFRIIDTETTGIAPPDGAIVELASLDVVGGRLGEGCSSLVNPLTSIPAEASAIHGITDADVADAPLLEEVLAPIVTDGMPEFYAAHNAAFEMLWLAEHLKAPVICTMKCAMRVWPEAGAFNLAYLRYWLCLGDLGSRAMPPHRALPDCFITAHVLGRLFSEATVEQMLTWSKEPALHPRIPLGMHKDKKWSAAPDSYLDWMLNKPNDLSEDLKWCARLEVKRRYEETRENIVARWITEISGIASVEALKDWWNAKAIDRANFDFDEGDDGYARIVAACTNRKTAILQVSEQTA